MSPEAAAAAAAAAQDAEAAEDEDDITVEVRSDEVFLLKTCPIQLRGYFGYLISYLMFIGTCCELTTTMIMTTTILRPFFRDHPGEPVPEENFWTLWCNGRLREADTPTIRLGATPSGLTSADHHPPICFTGRMLFLPPNQQCQSTEGN